jgi:hypothetical protein
LRRFTAWWRGENKRRKPDIADVKANPAIDEQKSTPKAPSIEPSTAQDNISDIIGLLANIGWATSLTDGAASCALLGGTSMTKG